MILNLSRHYCFIILMYLLIVKKCIHCNRQRYMLYYTELTRWSNAMAGEYFREWNRDVLFAWLDNCRAERVTLVFDVCKQSNDIEKEDREHRSLDEVTFAEYECSIVPNLICLLGISICPPT